MAPAATFSKTTFFQAHSRLFRGASLVIVGLLVVANASFNADAMDPASLPAKTRLAFVGNGTAQRMSLYGHLETMLHLRTAQNPLVVRNFGWPADEVSQQIRPGNYTVIDDPFRVFAPQAFLCFFGMNESFAGDSPEQIAKFESDYHAYLDRLAKEFSEEGRPAQFALVTPIAFEPSGNPLQPDGSRHNRYLAAYADAVKRVGEQRELKVIDVFTPTAELFQEEAGCQYTVNGLHLNEAGDEVVALLIDAALFDQAGPQVGAERFEKMRQVVNDKDWLHQQDYRMLNGWYVYGGRRTWDTETFPGEFKKIRKMVAVRDQYLWDMAAGKSVPDEVDDSATGEVFIPETMFGSRSDSFRDMREPTTLDYPTPEESISQMKIPEGFEVQCFASEADFPELANPTQIAFDQRGRLWVSCMVNYPQWLPGKSRPSDRLLIFEDTDGDGKADQCKPFYDKLICPTGFEFYKDGVLVIDEPHILFLRDTDGDDVADEVTHMLDGIGTDDTHHAMGAWEYSNGGRLHMQEGIAMTSTVETPWGPVRNVGSSGSYVWDLESLRLTHFRTPGQYNPWCLVFDRFGNGIIGDGTNAQHHWTNALSGGEVRSRKTLEPIFNNHGIRPAAGNEILRSRQFPEEYRNRLIYACVINMHGMPAFELRDQDDEAGLTGERTDDLLSSTDMFFRPVDPKIGPDGALWFGDWCNALIGHMQYSQRDPNRDHEHGRIYRMWHKDRPMLDVVTQTGLPTIEVMDQLLAYETRTRYRARRALRERSVDEVKAAASQWMKDNPSAEAALEVLWLQEHFHNVDLEVAKKVLAEGNFQQRAAATHVVANEWRFLSGNEQANSAEQIELSVELPFVQFLLDAGRDEHPRVRLESVRAASLLNHPVGVRVALAGIDQPEDKWVAYVLEHTMSALSQQWDGNTPEIQQLIASLPENAAEYLKEYKIMSGPGAEVYRPLKTLADVDAEQDEQLAALQKVVAASRGSASNGAKVFERVCSACHQHGKLGKEFGPNLTDIGMRMSKEHIIRSIVWPNEEIAKGYETVMILTFDGEAIGGFILKEDEETITLGIADGKTKEILKDDIEIRKPMKASSMPEGLTETVAPSEFLDLLAFLTGDWVATDPNSDFPLRKDGEWMEVTRDSMILVPGNWPSQWNREARHLLSGEGDRRETFAIHSNQPETNPAVVIRLANPAKLIRGTITNRRDKAFYDRAKGLAVWTSMDGEQWTQVWKSEGPKAEWNVELPEGTQAQYIKIGLEGSGIFHIDKALFFGKSLESK